MGEETSRAAFGRRDVLRAGTGAAAGLAGLSALDIFGGSTASADVDEVDYVIIGSGPGGAPLAANLAEAGFSVMVLEAGPPGGNEQWYEVPALQLKAAAADKMIRWDYWIQHYSDTAYNQTCSQWRAGKGVLYPRASTLGGCTSHNAMITMYPEPSDWAYIQQITGDKSWAPDTMWGHWESMLKWQTTEFGIVDAFGADPVIGGMVAAAKEEAKKLPGGSVVDDRYGINRKKNVDISAQGYFFTPGAMRKGRRYGPRERLRAAQAKHPKLLNIVTDALAERVILKEEGGKQRAVGVEYLACRHLYAASPSHKAVSPTDRKAMRRTVRARKEVIVAGGAFNSPQLLMLSGIGPRDHLAQYGIPVTIDLPGVGSNLQDRYEIPVVTQHPSFPLLALCSFGQGLDLCQTTWDITNLLGLAGLSPYGFNGNIGGIRRHYGKDKRNQLFIFGSPSHFRGYVPGFDSGYGHDIFTWLVLKGYAQSRAGTVRLRSNDPTQPPVINFRYFEDGKSGDEDVAALLDSIAMIRRINKKAGTGTELWPGPKLTEPADLAKWVRKETWGHHASCTNPIGPDPRQGAVLDGQFRVHGTHNLRVVDASAFPRIPGLFIWAPTAIISEKASADILASAGKAGPKMDAKPAAKPDAAKPPAKPDAKPPAKAPASAK